jgi:hypothetical protein
MGIKGVEPLDFSLKLLSPLAPVGLSLVLAVPGVFPVLGSSTFGV